MRAPFGIELVYLLAGPLIWSAHYLFIYAVNALRCARSPALLSGMWLGFSGAAWMIVMSSLLALIAMGWVVVRQYRRKASAGEPAFHARLTTMLCLLSAMAVVWQTLPVFMVSACGNT